MNDATQPKALDTRTAIVTGSTSGIGLAIARRFAAAGANVVINGLGDAGAIEAERARRAEGGIVNVRETVKAVVKTRAASKPKPKAKPRVVVVQDREHDEDEL